MTSRLCGLGRAISKKKQRHTTFTLLVKADVKNTIYSTQASKSWSTYKTNITLQN